MPSIQWELFNFQCSTNSGPQNFPRFSHCISAAAKILAHIFFVFPNTVHIQRNRKRPPQHIPTGNNYLINIKPANITYIHIHIYVHTYLHTYKYKHTYSNLHTHIHTYLHTFTYNFSSTIAFPLIKVFRRPCC